MQYMIVQSMIALPSLVESTMQADPCTSQYVCGCTYSPKLHAEASVGPKVPMLAVKLLEQLQYFGHSFIAEYHQSCGSQDCSKWQCNAIWSVDEGKNG